MHHAEILIGHFREMVGNWPVASCYLALWCHSHRHLSLSCNHASRYTKEELELVEKNVHVVYSQWLKYRAVKQFKRFFMQYCQVVKQQK